MQRVERGSFSMGSTKQICYLPRGKFSLMQDNIGYCIIMLMSLSDAENANILGHDVGMHCESLCDSVCHLRVATLCRHGLLRHRLLCHHTMQIHDKQICGPARSRKSLCYCGFYTGTSTYHVSYSLLKDN